MFCGRSAAPRRRWRVVNRRSLWYKHKIIWSARRETPSLKLRKRSRLLMNCVAHPAASVHFGIELLALEKNRRDPRGRADMARWKKQWPRDYGRARFLDP